jgi:peptidoglycan/xylan/chitin deacetylase (PgdA/CDA1 family)
MHFFAKRILKRQVQRAIAAFGRQNWAFPKNRLIILTYHRVLPRNHPVLSIMQPGMVVRDDTFAMHIAVLKRRFQLVSLREWVDLANKGTPLPERACAITLDDGWRDNFDYAFPILKDERVPATIFLVSDKIGLHESFWPERLARILSADGKGLPAAIWQEKEFRWLLAFGGSYAFAGGPPSPDELNELITRTKALPDNRILEMLTQMESKVPEPLVASEDDLLDWRQVRAMQASGFVEFGSHGRRHYRLTAELNLPTITDEICGSRDLIESRLGCKVQLFCYPNGDTTPEATELVRRTYMAACSTNRGWNTPTTDHYMLRRINIHQDTADTEGAFLARLSGWI